MMLFSKQFVCCVASKAYCKYCIRMDGFPSWSIMRQIWFQISHFSTKWSTFMHTWAVEMRVWKCVPSHNLTKLAPQETLRLLDVFHAHDTCPNFAQRCQDISNIIQNHYWNSNSSLLLKFPFIATAIILQHQSFVGMHNLRTLLSMSLVSLPLIANTCKNAKSVWLWGFHSYAILMCQCDVSVNQRHLCKYYYQHRCLQNRLAR